jgi:uncharacterized membrane protein YkvA (DUF1232 family)
VTERRSRTPRLAAKPSGARSPLADLGPTLGRLPRYVRLAGALLRDPDLSRSRKAALTATLGYVAMPLDLVPGIIPVAGQLDDLAALLLGLRYALRGCSAESADRHLREAKLVATDLDRDIAAVRSAAGWIAGAVARGSIRVGAMTVRGARRLVGIGARAAGRIAARSARSAMRSR